MEGILLYYKSKGKNPEKHKCVLVIGDSGGPYRDEFLMLNKDEKTIKMKVKLADMEKLAQYPRDGSWEFGTRAGKSFRYRSENDVENKRWFDLLDGFVNKRGGVNGNNSSTIQALVLQPPNNQAPPSQTSSNNNSFAMQPQNNNARNDSNKSQQQQQQQPIIADGIRNGWDYYNVKIVDTRSTSTICAKFLIDDIYEFSLEQYTISLKNKFNVQDNHRIGSELIRSFGFYDGYFCIELGRRSGYGEGYLTLNSTRSDANRVHRHLYELTRQTFDQLKQEMDREETPRIRNDANGSFENDDEEDEDDDDDDDMMERNRVNQIKYTNVYLQPQQQHQQYQQQAPPNPSQQQQQQQQVMPPPNNNNNNNSYQSQPLQQRPQQPQYLTIIREDNNAPASYHSQQQQPESYNQSNNNNNNRQQQPPPTTSKTANLKTTKVQIHRIEPTNQTQQSGYNNANNNNGSYQRPDYPYPDRSTMLSTSSSVDSDPYQYRPYQTQSPNDEFMRGQQQQDMNVYKAVLVNNVYEPNNNQNTTTAQNSTKGSQKNQKQPPPQQQQQQQYTVPKQSQPQQQYQPPPQQQYQPPPQQQQQYTVPKQTQPQQQYQSPPQQQYQPPPQQQSYYTNGAATNGNGTAGRIGMNGMDHSGFSLVEEIEHYESETDESFYEERYMPHYVSNSNRNLSSSAAALEYFQDSGNTVYGKFKL